MEDTTTEVTLLMNRAVAEPLIILIGRRWTVVAIVVVMSMGVVEEGVGLVLDGTTTGETIRTTQKMTAGTVELPADGHYPVQVRTIFSRDILLPTNLFILGSHHPGRSDSGWRNRDESKKDSLLPEWAQQDTTDAKSTQKVYHMFVDPHILFKVIF